MVVLCWRWKIQFRSKFCILSFTEYLQLHNNFLFPALKHWFVLRSHYFSMGFRQYQDFPLEIFVNDWKRGDFQVSKISGGADLVPYAPSVTLARINLIWVLYPPFSQLGNWNSQRMRGRTISTVSSLEWRLFMRPYANTKGCSDTQLQKLHSSSDMVIT